MNQTRNVRVKRIESAFAFITAQVDEFNRKTFLKRKREKAVAKRLVSTATAIVMTVVSVIPLHAAETATPVVSEPQQVFETSLKLDSQNYSLLAIEQPTIEIKPGKSLAQEQEEARLRELAKRQQTKSVNTSSQAVIATRSIPTEERHRLAQEAAAAAGIPDKWKIIAAIHWKESGGKEGCIRSAADGKAMGGMQFMPSTFEHYKPHAGANICKITDSMQAAANLLKANGIEQNQKQAVFAYNHSTTYVNSVEAIANSIQ